MPPQFEDRCGTVITVGKEDGEPAASAHTRFPQRLFGLSCRPSQAKKVALRSCSILLSTFFACWLRLLTCLRAFVLSSYSHDSVASVVAFRDTIVLILRKSMITTINPPLPPPLRISLVVVMVRWIVYSALLCRTFVSLMEAHDLALVLSESRLDSTRSLQYSYNG